jgi:hypothetical protein
MAGGFGKRFQEGERAISAALATGETATAEETYGRLRAETNSLPPAEGEPWKARLLALERIPSTNRVR